MNITTNYEPVRRTYSKSLPCPVCGKKLRRQKTFQMTLSPFNKNPDGTVRTRGDIWLALNVVGAAWMAAAETHSTCSETP